MTRYMIQVKGPDGAWKDTVLIFESMLEAEMFAVLGSDLQGKETRVVPA